MTALDLTVACAFLLAGVVSFVLMGADKWKARRGRARIPERVLLLWCALMGGTGGYFGMQVFRHKTRKKKFAITVPVLMLLQLMLLAAYFAYLR